MEYQIKKCFYCGKEFKPATSNARYCSDECRKAVAKRNSSQQATKNKLDRQLQREAEKKSKDTPPPETPTYDDEGKYENHLSVGSTHTTPPETPAPDVVPPTETTVPLNGDMPEDKGESESKPFRKFFYD